ncbi:hypothetical protein SJAV_17820 [Sulfurisphaera javensis]|uniref:SRPBCC family protein n=1 Tax=Sulfurisphaera javensis TaxID=2049879 RepID=A0AAT9GSQ3_9CREN
MIKFTICKEIGNEDKVWEIIKDPYKIPNYWKGTRELNIKEIGRNIYEGDIKFAFPSSGKVRIMVDDNSKRVIINYLSGPIRGIHEITIENKQLCSKWSVELSLLLKPMEKRTEEHFKSGTIHAIERIISEIT